MTRQVTPIVLLVLLSSLILNLFQHWRYTQVGLHPVVDVIDGDTIVIDNNRRVRLAGVDSPETSLCGSTESAKLLRSLVAGKKVHVVSDITDSWGRDVGTVYVGKTNVNLQIIASGWANYNSQDVADKEEIKATHQLAMEEGRGIYSSTCTQLEPPNPKCLIKTSVGNHNTKFYFFPGCSSYEVSKVQLYKGESWFCSEREAQKAGFTKSANCYDKTYKPPK